jgi:hypothetical protein
MLLILRGGVFARMIRLLPPDELTVRALHVAHNGAMYITLSRDENYSFREIFKDRGGRASEVEEIFRTNPMSLPPKIRSLFEDTGWKFYHTAAQEKWRFGPMFNQLVLH